jgi:hypothetical protein
MTRASTDEILAPPGKSRLLCTSKILVRALRYVPRPPFSRTLRLFSGLFLPIVRLRRELHGVFHANGLTSHSPVISGTKVRRQKNAFKDSPALQASGIC